jgi:hypothetical protein
MDRRPKLDCQLLMEPFAQRIGRTDDLPEVNTCLRRANRRRVGGCSANANEETQGRGDEASGRVRRARGGEHICTRAEIDREKSQRPSAEATCCPQSSIGPATPQGPSAEAGNGGAAAVAPETTPTIARAA